MTQIEPTTELIPRKGKDTQPFDDHAQIPAADWEVVEGELRKGSSTFWLATVSREGAPHVRPVFAAWTGASFVVASKRDAVKSRDLRADGRCTVTTDIGFLHVVVQGQARRVTDGERLQVASRAMQEVFGWPTEVVGEELDADYGAPTSGGPPFEVFEIRPQTAFGFPTRDDVEPTRWAFPGSST